MRTKHSDERLTPGVVIEDWNATPLGYNGNKLYHSPTHDSVTGDITGRRYRKYWNGLIDLSVQTTDEVEGHGILNDIQDYFIPYENHPRVLHADLHEVALGPMSPRSLQYSPPTPTHSAVATIEIEYLDETQRTLSDDGESVLQTFSNAYETL